MAVGGHRTGAGRPRGAVGRLAAEAVVQAKATGELPHQFLLRIVRGDTIDGYTPTIEQRVYAAVAAAPYFAPKLAAIEQRVENTIRGVISSKPMTNEEFIERYCVKEEIADSSIHVSRGIL